MSALKIQANKKLAGLMKPYRYKVIHGGRGSGKSWEVARALLIRAAQRPTRILCAREFQSSIADSVHKLLSDQIEILGLSGYYDVKNQAITSAAGSEFIFEGLRHNVTKIKSMEGIDIVWVEEGEKVSDNSWDVLIPTLRKANSEVWITFNPDQETDPTYKRFVITPPPDTLLVELNYADNPWFPDVLRREMEHKRTVDYDAYLHIWEGKCRVHSEAQVLHGKWRVDSFDTPTNADGAYFGADWGFSRDPTAGVKLWVKDCVLYVEHEVGGVGIELDQLNDLFRNGLPDVERHTLRADNARPETISHVNRKGLRCVAADKWSGSVEDGIAFLRSFKEIVIHERCKRTAEEARLWSYKKDRLTNDVLPVLVDANNHYWDAIRYALQPMIKKVTHLEEFMQFMGSKDK